jgi:hypothetical protein
MKTLAILFLLALSGCGGHKSGECYENRFRNTYARVIGTEDTEEGKMVNYHYADADDSETGIESWDGEGFELNYPKKVNCSLFETANAVAPLKSKIEHLEEKIWSLTYRIDDLETKKGKK